MLKNEESDLLRLAMMLDNQGNTTLEKYICKLVECVLFDLEDQELTTIEISKSIKSRFQLQFDVTEIQDAIRSKGKGRILISGSKYRLTPKVIDQLSSKVTITDQLKHFIRLFSRQQPVEIDEVEFLELLLNFLYYSFNSNVDNFLNIIGGTPQAQLESDDLGSFSPNNDQVLLINSFLSWDNTEKNKLFYAIVSSSYEYCMITTKKNPKVSKSIFRGKCFFLDTNIIFRMAGINSDERRFVVKSFVEKCKEVGIKLYYTNEVLDELYRVIDAQVNYIKGMTQGQCPVSSKYLQALNDSNDVSDFYSIYCNWSKAPQNHHNDYISFSNYLRGLIQNTLAALTYENIIINNNLGRVSELSEGLKKYKYERRSSRIPSDASIKSDIKNLLYVEQLRPKNASSLWQINQYFVSADQLLISWANSEFCGVPIVMIPSTWLSIILKFSGRTSDDDYKSYCLFMSLRQHRTQDDEISINPVTLLTVLSKRTVESELKERIISEIISNRSEYSFNDEDAYELTVEKAFDKILSEDKSLNKAEIERQVKLNEEDFARRTEIYQKDLQSRMTIDEAASRYAENKSRKKVNCYAKREWLRAVCIIILILIIVTFLLLIVFKIDPIYSYLLFVSTDTPDIILGIVLWLVGVLSTLTAYLFSNMWSYLGSDSRKNKLFNKYKKAQLKNLNVEPE